mmetsp:Transcript_16893/g.40889  ORF Transcript_16893/g.40889 Transcript_16893/m.40889 type:complete len:1111 (+) Transcript_16893:137-3469(+)
MSSDLIVGGYHSSSNAAVGAGAGGAPCQVYTDYSSCVRPHPFMENHHGCSWCESSKTCLDSLSASTSCPPTSSSSSQSQHATVSAKSATHNSSSSSNNSHHYNSHYHPKSVLDENLFNSDRDEIDSGISAPTNNNIDHAGVYYNTEPLPSPKQQQEDQQLFQLLSNGDEMLNNFFDDEYYGYQQWVFEMINVGPVWAQGIFGDGVRVRVNDDGVDGDNIEFEGRFEPDSGCDGEEQLLLTTDNQHGTSTASILGATAGNGVCSAGVAPLTLISSCFALQDDEDFLQAKLDLMDVSNNSYERPVCHSFERRARDLLLLDEEEDDNRNGARRLLQPASDGTCPFTIKPSDSKYDPCIQCDFASDRMKGGHGRNPSPECVTAIVGYCGSFYEDEVEGCSDFLDLIIGGQCSYTGLSSTARTSLIRGVQQGRNGLGVVYVFASGNSNHEGAITTTKGYTNSRLVITVGAVGKDGSHASYSTPGSSVFVAAPGADKEDEFGQISAKVGGGCIDAGTGTSFAAPVVSGVAALMLEVNPDLGWRDVQSIIALTSQRVDDIDDPTAAVNAAGFWHSNYYGFGIVDASQAVEVAKTWENAGPEKMITIDSGAVDLQIFDDSTTPTVSTIQLDTVTVTSARDLQDGDFVIESVELLLDISHFSRGDLEVTLTSPSGTKSVLHPGGLPENSQLSSDTFWKLLTVRNWGESPFGEWTLTLTDTKKGHLEECVDDGEFFFLYGQSAVYCAYLEYQKICVDGGYNDEFFNSGNFEPLKERKDSNGNTMTDSCCACGGGKKRDEVQDSLRHWTLVIYGSLNGGSTQQVAEQKNDNGSTEVNVDNVTDPATPQPTEPLTKSPTASPSSPPVPETESPTTVPPTSPPVPATESPTTSSPTPPPVPATQAPTTSSPTPPPVPATQAPTTSPPTAPPTSVTQSPTTSPPTAPLVPVTQSPTTSPPTEPPVPVTQSPTTSPPTAPPTSVVTDTPVAATTSPPVPATATPTSKGTDTPVAAPTLPPTSVTQSPTTHTIAPTSQQSESDDGETVKNTDRLGSSFSKSGEPEDGENIATDTTRTITNTNGTTISSSSASSTISLFGLRTNGGFSSMVTGLVMTVAVVLSLQFV